MAQEIQSGDKKEYSVSEMERFFSYQEIWYKQYVRPAIKEDVAEQFQKCSVPIVEKINEINTRLLIKSIAIFVVLVLTVLLSISVK